MLYEQKSNYEIDHFLPRMFLADVLVGFVIIDYLIPGG